MARSVRWIASLLGVASLVAGGCGSNGDGTDRLARSELREAAEKTLAATSFRLDIGGAVGRASGQTDESGRPSPRPAGPTYYNAPDRVHMTPSVADPGADVIGIGADVYVRFGPPGGDHAAVFDPAGGKYRKRTLPRGSVAENMLRQLKVVRDAESVSADGDEYDVDLGEVGQMRVTVDDGHVVKVVHTGRYSGPGELEDDEFTVVHRYSEFGTAEHVEPPPDDQVVEGDGGAGQVPEGLSGDGVS